MSPPPDITPGLTRAIAVPLDLAPAVERMIAEYHSRGVVPAAATLDYPTAPAIRPRPSIDLPLAAALLTVTAVLTYLMIGVVPKFEMIFKDFGTELPYPTKLLLGLS